MKILVVLPNWLGDAIMATPAIELLAKYYENVEFTFLGSFASIEALKYHPNCKKAVVDETKKQKNRIKATYNLAKKLGEFDLAITFRKQLHSSLLLRFLKTKTSIARSSWHSRILLPFTPKIPTNQHLVKQYAQLAMTCRDDYKDDVPNLVLYIEPKKLKNQTIGINAGATYGSAKRWYPHRFAEVAKEFSKKYDIIIFGGPNEVETSKEIEESLKLFNVENYTNLAGKTSLKELCENIAGCDIFITNDSGPMHIAAAYQVPTVAIFGPTKHNETSQWQNEKSIIVREDVECAPCMKRECPLGHHKCMQEISSQKVIQAVKELKI